MTLATDADLEARLGRDLTAAEAARSTALLEDVSASVKLYTGQLFARADYTLRTRVKRGYIRLPQRPVVDVASVTDLDGNAVEHTFDGIDRVYLSEFLVGCPTLGVVDVTYEAGPETVPDAIVGIVCSIVLRSLGTDPLEGSVVQESIDGYSYSIGSAGGAGAYGLLPDEARVLNRFRRAAGSIMVAR